LQRQSCFRVEPARSKKASPWQIIKPRCGVSSVIVNVPSELAAALDEPAESKASRHDIRLKDKLCPLPEEWDGPEP
jgi:hypothetical protein